MTKLFFNSLVILVAIVGFSAQSIGGASTTTIVLNGPNIPHQIIKGTWPGATSFIDRNKGPAPEPTSDLPRYVLVGYTDDNSVWYNVLYVWDDSSNRALVYTPGPSELGFRANYEKDLSYVNIAGKWWDISDQKMNSAIRKALPTKKIKKN